MLGKSNKNLKVVYVYRVLDLAVTRNQSRLNA